MRVLHISDLHVSKVRREKGDTLRDVWRGPAHALHDQRFDFVIISGDLSQRATSDEYTELIDLLTKDIEQLVRCEPRESPKPRIVLVPGNHDVDWLASVYRPLSLTDLEPEEIAEKLKDARDKPETSRVRVQTSSVGHISLYDVDPALYPTRFAKVQKFFDDYYAGTLIGSHRPFNLLDPTGQQAWSAHVFPSQRVAFLGFSSCHENDKYWHGSRILSSAITQAKDHVDRIVASVGKGFNFLRVAVWHHGLESHRCRPDRLLFEDLGALLNSEIRVGFHGHVHLSAHAVHRFIADDFALVSTGSLGASSDELPENGNQFSIVELQWNRALVSVYERDARENQYEHRRDRYLYFERSHNLDPSRPIRSCARRVVREMVLFGYTGLSRISVSLEDLYLVEPVALAHLTDRLRCRPDQIALVGNERVKLSFPGVDETRPECDGQRFEFAGQGSKERYAGVSWSYRFTNALALTAAELALLEDRRTTHPHLPDGYEVWSHIVQFDYDHLDLRFRYEPPTGTTVEYIARGADGPDVQPIVEQRGPDGTWQRVPPEEARCEITRESNQFTLRCASPVMGRRYGAMFRLDQIGTSLDAEVADAVSTLVDVFRNDRQCGTVLRTQARDFSRDLIGQALNLRVATDWSNEAVVVGTLWDQSSRLLHPCFGDFPPSTWCRSFRGGQGIAGHAYRFGRPAAWHREIRGEWDLIKLPSTSGRDYRWILCLPLLARPGGPAVGVVGFASVEESAPISRELSGLARRIARMSPTETGADSWDKQLTVLWVFSCAAFWTSVHKAGAALPRHVLEIAARSLSAFDLADILITDST
ncbi:MAG TPA: metallophosphoesterase [Kofleriaceae bacterium]|nr:metallophosphoesterase [Kofleriaceae bacterium]